MGQCCRKPKVKSSEIKLVSQIITKTNDYVPNKIERPEKEKVEFLNEVADDQIEEVLKDNFSNHNIISDKKKSKDDEKISLIFEKEEIEPLQAKLQKKTQSKNINKPKKRVIKNQKTPNLAYNSGNQKALDKILNDIDFALASYQPIKKKSQKLSLSKIANYL
jgi:hypothetical protein